MECTIKTIIRKERNKEGQPYINQKGQPFTLISLQVEELPGEWMSGFANDLNAEWKNGDKIDIAITEKQVGNKLYKNFKNLAQKSSRLDALEANVKKLMLAVFTKQSNKSIEEIGDEIDVENIPF